MKYSTGDIQSKYEVMEVVFAYSDSNDGFQYEEITQTIGESADELGADAVIFIAYQQREYTGSKQVCFKKRVKCVTNFMQQVLL